MFDKIDRSLVEKILIVDDDVDTLKLVGLMLQKQGFQIIAATNGNQGLAQAEAESPDLILLDVMMPEMDGYEVAKRLRANPQTSTIPILMFTAKTQLDDKVTGFEAGADDYLTKPTHPTELTAHIRSLLSRAPKGQAQAAAGGSEKRAFTIGVMAPRGGWGVSTVAINLGGAIYDTTKTEVVVAELRPGMGTIGPELGLTEPLGLTRLLQSQQGEISRQKVKDELFHHDSGVRVLPASINSRDSILLNNTSQMEMIVTRLAYSASYLILDLGPGLPPLTQRLIKTCQQLIVIVEPVPNSIQHAKAMIADLVSLGVSARNIQAVVVNRLRSDLQLNASQTQEKLEHPIPVVITPAPELLYQAARNKAIASIAQAGSLTGQQFAKLASTILELEKQPL
jgi:DNA-binding response OmpR family regulator